jgi:pantoate--beta-alanine ligase
VTVADVAEGLEGATRPTHFAGVATVVAKLFSIVGPCRAYFGEKDFQQVVVITRMVRDLSMPVEVVACPTVREPDGLAMSSRNAYLTAAERSAAPVIHQALHAGATAIQAGERHPANVAALVEGAISAEPLAVLDYVAVVDAATLRTIDPLRGPVRLLAAARFGRARLIDNVGAHVGTDGAHLPH